MAPFEPLEAVILANPIVSVVSFGLTISESFGDGELKPRVQEKAGVVVLEWVRQQKMAFPGDARQRIMTMAPDSTCSALVICVEYTYWYISE
jgi:hypothetical protein